MQFLYTPERVCSKKFMIEVDDNSRTITNFEYLGGCPGNLRGISRLLRGMRIDEVIDRFADMPICPSSKVTSCPEQIRNALLELRRQMDSGQEQKREPFGLGAFSATSR